MWQGISFPSLISLKERERLCLSQKENKPESLCSVRITIILEQSRFPVNVRIVLEWVFWKILSHQKMSLELKKLRDFDDGKKILIDETYFV